MNIYLLLFSLFILLLSGCGFDAAEEEVSDGLISNHREVENAFTVTGPEEGTYKSGDKITFKLTHPFTVIVSASPQLELDIGGNSEIAEYASGSGTKTLSFTYIVQDGDEDDDGIEVASSIDLNGSTITFTYNDEEVDAVTDLDSDDLDLTTTLIDTTDPVLTLVYPPANRIYFEDKAMYFTATFDGAVNVTGTPQISFDLGGTTVKANYYSGSGETNIVFKYVVEPDDIDSDGITLISPMGLNSGTITDAAGNNATLTFPVANIPGVIVDGNSPYRIGFTKPDAGTYYNTDIIEFSIQYNQKVYVTGSPSVDFLIGAATKSAVYNSGTGTDTLTFAYTVTSGDQDEDGILIGNTVALNLGTIQDADANDASLVTSPPLTANVLVSAGQPEVDSIVLPADGTYELGDTLSFTLTFDKAVDISGTPRLPIYFDSLNPTPSYAQYQAGSGTTTVVFTYVVDTDAEDTDGIVLGNTLNLNGGTINSTLGTSADLDITTPVAAVDPSGILIDGLSPTISSVSPPANGWYVENDILDFTLTISETVTVTNTPRIALNIGGTTVYADFLNGSGSTSLIFRATLPASLTDSDGIGMASIIDLNTTGVIQDANNNNLTLSFTAADTSAILVDSVEPYVASITPPSNDNYIEGEDVSFIVNMNEAVTVVNTPRLVFDVGGPFRYANYASGSGTTALTFTYTVGAGDLDANGIGFGSLNIDLNVTGTIRDSATNDADPYLTPVTGLPDTSSIFIDAVAPSISSNTIAAATYKEDDVISFVVNYDDNVTVSGAPRISLTFNTMGSPPLYASYASGSGSTALTFNYTVASGDEDPDGIVLAANIDLNSGTMKDSNGNDADLALATTSFPTVLVDGIAPSIAITTPAASSYINIGSDSATFTISGTCDENGETAVIKVDTVSATSQVDFLCNGANFTGTIDTTGLGEGARNFTATLGDAAGNSTTSSSVTVTKDTERPTVSSVTITDGNYTTGQSIGSTVTFSELVTVAVAVPTIGITVGATGRSLAGSMGTNTSFSFAYSVVASEYDYDGVAINSSIVLNGGTISDAAGNSLTDTSLSAPDGTYVRVIEAGMEVWLDGSDISTLFTDSGCSSAVVSNLDPVGCWEDRSGNGNNATQSTASYRPTYATNVMNGESGVNFDGSNDFFDDARSIDSKTVYIVFKSYNTAGEAQLWGNYFDGNHTALLGASGAISLNGNASAAANEGAVSVYGGAASGADTIDTAGAYWTTNTDYLFKTVYDENTITHSRQTIGILDPVNVGSDQFDGEIMEIIIFSGTLDAGANTALENYFASKYGL